MTGRAAEGASAGAAATCLVKDHPSNLRPSSKRRRRWHDPTIMKPRELSLHAYEELLCAMQGSGHYFRTFSAHLQEPDLRSTMLRHDVDDRKLHSLVFARIQHGRGIRGTYYFRMVPQSFDERVIKEVHALGHEVGYHYEEMDLCRGDAAKAFDLFRRNLDRLRAIVPITSICMHGSPRSRFDNKDIWKLYDYRRLGLLGEPYLDLDFSRTGYYTDTGGRWDGGAYSVRDRVTAGAFPRFRSTEEMTRSVRQRTFPQPVMLTFHPQRWTDSTALLLRDRLVQHMKNYAKYGIIQWRSLRASRQ